MPRLLSKEEADKIATKMAEEYGLSARIVVDNYSNSFDTGLKGEIGRIRKVPVYDYWFPWYKKNEFVKIRDFYAENFEDVLSKLQGELSRFDNRAKIAEQLREKYVMQEADELLNEVLSETPTS
jgi:hypothetical protein